MIAIRDTSINGLIAQAIREMGTPNAGQRQPRAEDVAMMLNAAQTHTAKAIAALGGYEDEAERCFQAACHIRTAQVDMDRAHHAIRVGRWANEREMARRMTFAVFGLREMHRVSALLIIAEARAEAGNVERAAEAAGAVVRLVRRRRHRRGPGAERVGNQ